MSIILPKSYIYQVLFALCIGVPYLNSYELTFAVWIFSVIVTLKQSYSFAIVKYVMCFAAILGIAFVVRFYHPEYKTYFIIRDVTYMLKPVIGILLGYQLCRSNFNKAFQTVVYTGVMIALIHLYIIISAILFHHARNFNDIRLSSGFFSDYEVYVMIVLLFHEKFKLGFTKRQRQFFLILIGVSTFMYFARTNFIQFVILYLAMKGYLKINRRSILVLTSIVAVSIVGYSAIVAVNPKRNGPGIEGILYKIKIAPTEPFKTKINTEDWKDFNDNYRSYENIHTVKQMTRKGLPTLLFGSGLGSRIDLKREVWLGDMMLRYISILHNGFMTVFLKSGLVGIFIYLYTIFLLFRQRKSRIPIISNINLLLVGTGVFLIFSNWVFLGVYNLLDNKSILIGFLICYKEIADRKALAEIIEND